MQQIDAPVIFFPGTLCDERIWLPVWRQLKLSQRSYVPLQWADNLEQMLALSQDRLSQYEQPVHLVGFSMGGYIAALTALQCPANIASLTLIGYHPGGLSDAEMQQRKGILTAIERKRFSKMDKARLAHFFSPEELHIEDLTEVVVQMEKDLGAAVLANHIRSTTPRKDLIESLAKVPFKLHYITAQHDKIASAKAIGELCQNNANADFSMLENTAHMLLLSEPKKCAELITRHLSA